VYAISDEQAIVETVDFFTPVVDDPYWFGRIGAANAMSDIWAMGARPLFALNLVAFPITKLPQETLAAILRGGADAAREAGVPILGGHSIDDPEPKYGMAVTGLVHPQKILRNVGARPGDRLLLTKPIGSGVVTTAIKRGAASPREVERGGAVHALTDVTGFGLLGDAWEIAEGSGVSLRICAGAVPLLEGVLELAGQDMVPGGTKANYAWVEEHVTYEESVDPMLRVLLADAQTNGGLLAAVAGDQAASLRVTLASAGVAAVDIGDVLESGGTPRIEVVSK
jgi:selenide,water dikinase